MAFYVGQKVVCVDVAPFPYDGTAVPLVLDRVYTVAGHDKYNNVVLAEQPGVTNSDLLSSELGYRASRFRPVVEREYDISIFKAMLNPSDKRVDA